VKKTGEVVAAGRGKERDGPAFKLQRTLKVQIRVPYSAIGGQKPSPLGREETKTLFTKQGVSSEKCVLGGFHSAPRCFQAWPVENMLQDSKKAGQELGVCFPRRRPPHPRSNRAPASVISAKKKINGPIGGKGERKGGAAAGESGRVVRGGEGRRPGPGCAGGKGEIKTKKQTKEKKRKEKKRKKKKNSPHAVPSLYELTKKNGKASKF